MRVILQGVYSRRINIQYRLVYQVYNQPVVINETEYEESLKLLECGHIMIK